jgi:hypothetical protein
MRALVDSDILAHELAWGAEFVSKDEDTKGDEVLLGFDHVENLILNKLAIIQDEVEATEPPLLFITNSETVNKILNRRRRWLGEEEVEFVPNFRFEVAKERPYKGTRANKKPFHFYNILAYFMANYDVIINEQGLEADDAICTYQESSSEDTIICSRDKDLRMQQGWHYSWECGKQGAIGPVFTDELGWLETPSRGKILGYGKSFFYSQLLTGDTVDNIAGLPSCGAVGAYKLLQGADSERALYEAVRGAYEDKLGDGYEDYLLEQGQLLYMVNETNGDESPKMWEIPFQ